VVLPQCAGQVQPHNKVARELDSENMKMTTDLAKKLKVSSWFVLGVATLTLNACVPNIGQLFTPSVHPIHEDVLSNQDSTGQFLDGDTFSSRPTVSNWRLTVYAYALEPTFVLKLIESDLFFALNPNTPRSILEKGVTLQFKSPDIRVGVWNEATAAFDYQNNPVWEMNVPKLPTQLTFQFRHATLNLPPKGFIDIDICPIIEKVSCYTTHIEISSRP
jgi:hypothetical protein